MNISKKVAFSVIEIVVVLAVMVILAAVAMVKLGTYDNMKLDAAARKVASDIRYAQRYTMTQMQRVWIDFDLVNERYSIKEGVSPFNVITDPLTKGSFVVDFNSGELKGVKINTSNFGGREDLGFSDSLGRPCGVQLGTFDAPSSFTTPGSVSISYKTLPQKTISVEPETGEVSIQ